MIIYFAFILLSAVSYLSPALKHSNLWWRVFVTANCIFLCFGYMCGSDWRQYEPMYEDIDFNNLFYQYYAEPGYYIYMLIGRLLNVSFWPFFICTKIICFLIITHSLKILAFDYRYLAWTIFLPQAGFYMFIDNPMRNLIAVSIFLMSMPYLIKREKCKYFLSCILALTFHLTAIITPLFYYLFPKKISSRVYIIVLIIIFILFSTPDTFETVLTRVSGLNPFILKKVEWYILGDSPDSGGSAFSIGAILQIIFYFLILKSRKAIENKENGLIILNGALIFILVYRLGLTISIFSRLQLYLVIFYVVGISFTLNAFKNNARQLITCAYLAYACFVSYKNISTNGWKYIPYSNYLTSITDQDQKSFGERSNYNLVNTPYKDTIHEDD